MAKHCEADRKGIHKYCIIPLSGYSFSSRKCYDLLCKVAVVRRMLGFQNGSSGRGRFLLLVLWETGLLSSQKRNYFNISLGSNFYSMQHLSRNWNISKSILCVWVVIHLEMLSKSMYSNRNKFVLKENFEV